MTLRQRLGIVGVAVMVATASPAHADVSEADLRGFEKGKSTYAEVTAKLGKPARPKSMTKGCGPSPTPPPRPGQIGQRRYLRVLRHGRWRLHAGRAQRRCRCQDRWRFGGLCLRSLWTDDVLPRGRGCDQSLTSEDGAAPMPNVKSRSARINSRPRCRPEMGSRISASSLFRSPIWMPSTNSNSPLPTSTGSSLPMSFLTRPAKKRHRRRRLSLCAERRDGRDVRRCGQAMSTVKKGDTIVARVKRIDESAHLAKETVFNLKVLSRRLRFDLAQDQRGLEAEERCR